MRILLVSSPKIILGFDRATKLPNLGLNSIAANIRRPDVDVRILDLVLAPKDPDQYFINYLKNFEPDIVGFSCMTFQYYHTLKLAQFVRNHNSRAKIVFGGYHPTVDYTTILNSPDARLVDFIIRNEGEITFNLLLEHIQGDGNFTEIPSLSYIENETVHHNPQSGLLDLDHIKIPDRECRVIKRGFHILGRPADVIETSRGCVNKCKFCSIRQMYGTQFRKYKIERVLQDIKDARHHGAQSILFSDDNIAVDAVRFENLCNEIINHQLNDIKYAVQASLSALYRVKNLPKLMADAGIDICFLGIENQSGSNLEFLDAGGKINTDTQEIISELQGRGITVIGSFIIGNPDDTRDTIYENFHYANALGVDVPLYLILTPFPKTEIREELLKNDLITNASDYSKYDLFHANVRTHALTSQDLEKIRDEIAFKIFSKGSRILKLVKKYPGFSAKILLNQLIHQPGEIVGYIRGMIR